MAKDNIIIDVYNIEVKMESIRDAIHFIRDNGLESKAVIKAEMNEDIKEKYIKKYPKINIK